MFQKYTLFDLNFEDSCLEKNDSYLVLVFEDTYDGDF